MSWSNGLVSMLYSSMTIIHHQRPLGIHHSASWDITAMRPEAQFYQQGHLRLALPWELHDMSVWGVRWIIRFEPNMKALEKMQDWFPVCGIYFTTIQKWRLFPLERERSRGVLAKEFQIIQGLDQEKVLPLMETLRTRWQRFKVQKDKQDKTRQDNLL